MTGEIHIHPWQRAAWSQLRQRVESNRLPHALLLCGPEGLGKRAMAQRLGQLLLCQAPREGMPCGVCDSCQLVQAGNHPDLYLVEPEEGSKTIKVDAVRELSRSLGLKSQYGGRRVGLITPAERMTVNAANSLLKTLEEPPEDAVLVLVSHHPAGLPATIRSRCQMQTIPAPDVTAAAEWLEEQGASGAEGLLGLVGNAPLAAMRLHEQGGGEAMGTLLDQLADLAAGTISPVEAAGRWQKDQIDMVTRLLVSIAIDLARTREAGLKPRISRLNQLPGTLDSLALHGFLDDLLEQRRLAEHPLNAHMQLEALLVRWRDISAREGVHG